MDQEGVLMPTEKECSGCRTVLPLAEFSQSKNGKYGRAAKCKSCMRIYVERNREHVRAQKKRWEAANHKRLLEVKRAWRSTPEQKAIAERQRSEYRKRNPEKARARQAVTRALRTGKLLRQPCQFCGESKTQAHHHDYGKPLDVIWVCFKCHREKFHDQVVITEESNA